MTSGTTATPVDVGRELAPASAVIEADEDTGSGGIEHGDLLEEQRHAEHEAGQQQTPRVVLGGRDAPDQQVHAQGREHDHERFGVGELALDDRRGEQEGAHGRGDDARDLAGEAARRKEDEDLDAERGRERHETHRDHVEACRLAGGVDQEDAGRFVIPGAGVEQASVAQSIADDGENALVAVPVGLEERREAENRGRQQHRRQ